MGETRASTFGPSEGVVELLKGWWDAMKHNKPGFAHPGTGARCSFQAFHEKFSLDKMFLHFEWEAGEVITASEKKQLGFSGYSSEGNV